MIETQKTFGEQRWYVACVRSRHEKRVAQQLEQRNIEAFLPLFRTVRRWKDRRKLVDLPLFPGYLFVQIPVEDRLEVLRLYGVARFVGFNGVPAEVSASDLGALRAALLGKRWVEPHPYLKVGKRVRVRSGPLTGAEGVLLRKKSDLRLILSFDAILRAASVEVDAADVEPIGWTGPPLGTEFEQSVNAVNTQP